MGVLDNLTKSQAKTVTPGNRNIKYWAIVVLFLAIAFGVTVLSAISYQKDVDVVSLNKEIGNKAIKESDLTKLTIAQRDASDDMILWSDKDTVVNKTPAAQIRAGTPVFEDQITDKPRIRYQYLYELQPDEELVTFVYNPSQAGGRIPKPGDRFRIRGSYEMEDAEKNSLIASGTLGVGQTNTSDVFDENGQLIISATSNNDNIVGNVRTMTIFDVATVVDMLNGDGDSVFEIKKEVDALPLSEQEELYSKGKIQDKMEPKAILIIVKSSQVTKYVEYNTNNKVKYTLTLLSRDPALMDDDIKTGVSLLTTAGTGSNNKDTTN